MAPALKTEGPSRATIVTEAIILAVILLYAFFGKAAKEQFREWFPPKEIHAIIPVRDNTGELWSCEYILRDKSYTTYESGKDWVQMYGAEKVNESCAADVPEKEIKERKRLRHSVNQ